MGSEETRDSDSKPLSLETYQEFVELLRIGNRAVRRAQERNRKLGIPNVYSRNGKIYCELPNGELTEEDPSGRERLTPWAAGRAGAILGKLLGAPRRDLIPAPALERNFRMAAIPLERPVFYPESDGQPMGETPLHRREMSYLIAALEERFRRAADVYVSGNMFLYYERGRPRSVVAPDVFVARGIVDKDRERRVYKLWEEGVGPCLVIEVTSNNTRDEDLGDKKSLYERLGVAEYFLYDPEGDFIPERLRGFRLEGGRYFPFRLDDDGALASRTTGVTLRLESGRVRAHDTATGRPFLRPEEAADVVAAAEENARREAQARQAAEAEIERLKAEIARLRGGA